MKPSILKSYLLFLSTVLLAYSGSANAYTSVALIKDHVTSSISASFNYDSQKEADKSAVAGCRSEADKNGIGKLANQCKITLRAKGPGYGAISCGPEGCGYTTGFGSGQEAVDAAYNECTKSYQGCQADNITNWEDFAGFPQLREVAKTAVAKDCRPRTEELRCRSSCINGSCVIKYENGCQMQVEVDAQYDSFKNQWVYPSPSC